MSLSDTEIAPVHVGIVVGATRPGRRAASVAEWVAGQARSAPGATVEIVDLADADLPMYDEAIPPIAAQYANAHTQAWADRVAAFDAFIFVTPEYNHSIPGVLKNALDFIYGEWNDKAAGIVSYGMDAGGARAAEQLRLILGELQIAPVKAQVVLSLMDDVDPEGALAPRELPVRKLEQMVGQIVAWGGALRSLRAPAPA